MGRHGTAQTVADEDAGAVGIDRAGWAWEWLRRNPAYRQEAAMAPRVHRTILSRDPEIELLALPPEPVRADRWGLIFLRASRPQCG
jgi:hypothetical protein